MMQGGSGHRSGGGGFVTSQLPPLPSDSTNELQLVSTISGVVQSACDSLIELEASSCRAVWPTVHDPGVWPDPTMSVLWSTRPPAALCAADWSTFWWSFVPPSWLRPPPKSGSNCVCEPPLDRCCWCLRCTTRSSDVPTVEAQVGNV